MFGSSKGVISTVFSTKASLPNFRRRKRTSWSLIVPLTTLMWCTYVLISVTKILYFGGHHLATHWSAQPTVEPFYYEPCLLCRPIASLWGILTLVQGQPKAHFSESSVSSIVILFFSTFVQLFAFWSLQSTALQKLWNPNLQCANVLDHNRSPTKSIANTSDTHHRSWVLIARAVNRYFGRSLLHICCTYFRLLVQDNNDEKKEKEIREVGNKCLNKKYTLTQSRVWTETLSGKLICREILIRSSVCATLRK